jgi:hypothetical protein
MTTAPVLGVTAFRITALVGLTLFTTSGARADDPRVRFVPADGSPIPVGPMAGRPAVGDCNADGKPDIVVACGTC